MLRLLEGNEGTRNRHSSLHRQIDSIVFVTKIDTVYKQLGISTKKKN